jgi:hypothetical protein
VEHFWGGRIFCAGNVAEIRVKIPKNTACRDFY